MAVSEFGDCKLKQKFRTYYSATRFAEKATKLYARKLGHGSKDGHKAKPYRCARCNCWHLSTSWKDLDKKET